MNILRKFDFLFANFNKYMFLATEQSSIYFIHSVVIIWFLWD